MAITLHTDTTGSANPTGSTMSLTCAANDLILLAQCTFSTTPPSTPTMTGQTFTLVIRQATSATTLSVWSTVAASAYSGATVTIPPAPNGFLVMDAITGAASVDNSNSTNGATSTATGSVTTIANNCRVFAYIGTVGYSVTGAGGGYTLTGSNTDCAGEISNTASVSSGTNVTSSFGITTSGGTWAIATLSLAPAGGSTSSLRRRSQVMMIAP